VVGGSDSAVEAAIGLAMQKGNQVTLSYRKESFSRIKERNADRLKEAFARRQLEVVFKSIRVEFLDDRVMLNVAGGVRTLENDFVRIFAGGVAPNEFLKKIGVRFGPRDLTAEAVKEARGVVLAG